MEFEVILIGRYPEGQGCRQERFVRDLTELGDVTKEMATGMPGSWRIEIRRVTCPFCRRGFRREWKFGAGPGDGRMVHPVNASDEEDCEL